MPFFVTFEDGCGADVAPQQEAPTAANARAVARRAVQEGKARVAQVLEGESADKITKEHGAYHAEAAWGDASKAAAVWYPWKPRDHGQRRRW